MGNLRLSMYSLAGCELFRSSRGVNSRKMSLLNTGVVDTTFLTFLMSTDFLGVWNFSILYSLYSSKSKSCRSFGKGTLIWQLWHLYNKSPFSSKTNPLALFLFLCESPQYGHLKFQRLGFFRLNFSNLVERRFRYLISTYTAIYLIVLTHVLIHLSISICSPKNPGSHKEHTQYATR